MRTFEDLIAFAIENPTHSRTSSSILRRFLTELISSPKQIITLEDDSGLIAAAVLLDKVNNPSQQACLELFAIKEGIEIEKATAFFIENAKALIPAHKNGFQFDFHEKSPSLHPVKKAGLLLKYQSFNMQCDLKNFQIENFEQHNNIHTAKAEDSSELFDVIDQSMSDNLDTSIPDRTTWISHFENKAKDANSESHFYVYKENKIIGFANLVESRDSNEVELRTLGVVPTRRHQGIGQKLLQHSLYETKIMKYSSCHLRVALHNENALDLYLKMGFKTIDKYLCYEWKKT